MTWGEAEAGGKSSAVREQVKNVQQVQASSSAFAAIRDDGSVVTWGDAKSGGDGSSAQDQLRKIADPPL